MVEVCQAIRYQGLEPVVFVHYVHSNFGSIRKAARRRIKEFDVQRWVAAFGVRHPRATTLTLFDDIYFDEVVYF